MKAEDIDNPAWDLLQRVPRRHEYGMLGGIYGDGIPRWPHSETVPHDFGDHPAMTGNEIQMDLGQGREQYVFWRSWFTSVYSWAIPSPHALDAIASRLDGRPLVEIGAGNGYWAWCLSQMGVDVVAYDQAPFGHENSWYGGEAFLERQMSWADQQQAWFDVQLGTTYSAAKHPDRVLFLCWPPYGSPMAQTALEFYEGDTCLYIGEDYGGCNADDGFFQMVGAYRPWDDEQEGVKEQTWKQADYVPIPQFDGIHDALYVFERVSEEES